MFNINITARSALRLENIIIGYCHGHMLGLSLDPTNLFRRSYQHRETLVKYNVTLYEYLCIPKVKKYVTNYSIQISCKYEGAGDNQNTNNPV